MTNEYCLSPMTIDEIKNLVGTTFISSFQKEMDSILKPLQKHIEKGRPLSLGKEIWEYAISDSIVNGEWCGAGSNIVDVKIGNDIGIDVKSISISGNKTNSSSMYQTFYGETKKHFDNNNTENLWDLFVNGWYNKTTSIKNYYLMAIIRERETLDCSLCCFKLNPNIPVVYSNNLRKLNKKTMKVDGIVSDEYAHMVVYVSKTRLEISFKKKLWESKNHTLKIYKNPWSTQSNLIKFFISDPVSA